MDPENPNLYYNFQGQIVGSNPVELQKLEKNHSDTKLLDWDGTLKLNLLPLLAKDGTSNHNLSTQIMFADHQYSNNDSWFRPSTSTLAINGGYDGEASRAYSKERQYVVEWLANYNTRIADKHNIKAMVGYSYQYSQYQGFSAWNKDFPNDGLGADNIGSGELAKEEGEVLMSSYKNDAKLISFFGRVSYDFEGKYLFTASLRHEGSSKFGANHKWGDFPAVSAGWRISQESFMKDIEWINDLKIRADYGVTGNQDFGSYNSLSTMTGFGYYFYNGKYYQVWGPSKNVNPDLRWEKGKNWNIGLDFSLFNNRFYGSLNYFNRRQQDLLGNYKVSVPPYLFDETFVNVGTMKNTGFEFDLSFNAVNTKDFSYNFNVIGTMMSNKFVDFSNSDYVGQDFYNMCGTEDPYPYYNLQRIEKGKSLGNFYMWKYAGITNGGDWLVYDKDGDIIRASQATDEDRQVVGDSVRVLDVICSFSNRELSSEEQEMKDNQQKLICDIEASLKKMQKCRPIVNPMYFACMCVISNDEALETFERAKLIIVIMKMYGILTNQSYKGAWYDIVKAANDADIPINQNIKGIIDKTIKAVGGRPQLTEFL